MKNLWTKFTSLSIIWKIVIIVAIFVGVVLVYDAATGGWSDFKGWMFDREYAARMEKIDQLTKENDALRAEKKEYEKQAVEAKAKEAVFDARQKDLDAKTKAELKKLDDALAAQDAVEATTEQSTDAYDRCVRTKQKMIELGIKSAGEMNCNEFQK